MKLPDLCIRRPVFAIVVNLLILLVGAIAYDRLSVREYPKIDEPVVTVETTYRGASAEIIETRVTQPLEDSLSGIEGINFMTSISRPEKSQITVTFRLTRDIEFAANDVRDRVARVRAALPDDINEPVVSKVEADAQPLVYLAFSSSRHSAMEVTDFADRVVRDRLQNVGGIASVRIFGERRYSMRVWLDPARMAAYGIAPADIEKALTAQNVEIPAGRIESSTREFTVVNESDLRGADEFADIVLRDTGGFLVRLKDVARIELGPADTRVRARFKGQSAVAMGVIKQSTANPLDVSKGVREALPEITRVLPPGMSVEVAYDSSIFIERSISNVYKTLAEAVALVVAVIFFFLRTGRATLIPLVTIPISLIGAFALMAALGFTINTLTLLALVLAIGLVVDDAIVMLENIYRHIEDGMEPVAAAFKGAREIAFAVLAMTITLAAVFAPMATTEGRTGKLFTEFALTLAGAVIVSGFVALTLSPMMCSRLLRKSTRHGPAYSAIEARLVRMTEGYRRWLERALRIRPRVVAGMLAIAALGGGLLFVLRSELSPLEDRGYVVAIQIAPEGSSLDFTDRYARQIEGIIGSVPEVTRYFMVVGFPVSNQAISFSLLKPWNERDRKARDIVASIGPLMFGVTGSLAFPVNPPSLGQSPVSKPLEFVVQTTGTYAELQNMVNKVITRAQAFPGLANFDSDLKLNKPELRVTVNRDKAAAAGIEVAVIGRALETMIGGKQVTRFKRAGKQYDVIVQVDDPARSAPDDIRRIYLPLKDGQMVPLANFVDVVETVAPRELNHFNKLRAATITATLQPGYTLGDGLAALTEAAREALPANAQIDYAGQSREFRESSTSLLVSFVLAIAFIYLVLAAQFESFSDPLIILLTVPLSIAGALATLYVTGSTINVYSQIGLITLIGLISKHGILIVEFANQLRDRGMSAAEAVREASVLRLRPILMTTGATVLGALPLAIASGAGAEARQTIGWTIVGGMSFGTLFTLFVVPVAYSYAAQWIARKKLVEAPPEA